MNLAEELEKLQKLHESGFLSADDLARAKARVLSDEPTRAVAPVAMPTADNSKVEHHLEQIRWQNELEQLDREWNLERERYMVADKYGHRRIPSEGGSIVGALVIGGFGLAWTIAASSMGAPGIFPLFGVVFIVLGVGSCIVSFNKAGGYEEARRRYEDRRAELLKRQNR